MIKLIGFDLDNTLWNLKPVLIQAEITLGKWLSSEVSGYTHEREKVLAIRNRVAKEEAHLLTRITDFRHRIIQLCLLEHGLSQAASDTLSQAAMEVFLKARNQITLFDGAELALTELAKTYTLCALSNGNADIKRLGLDSIFSFAYSAEQLNVPKPAPAMFQAAMEKCGVTADEMIYVGDDPLLDVDAAADLGIRTIWLDHGKKPPGRHPASQTIKDITELLGAVQRIVTD